jgi:hypothetical protein
LGRELLVPHEVAVPLLPARPVLATLVLDDDV